MSDETSVYGLSIRQKGTQKSGSWLKWHGRLLHVVSVLGVLESLFGVL